MLSQCVFYKRDYNVQSAIVLCRAKLYCAERNCIMQSLVLYDYCSDVIVTVPLLSLIMTARALDQDTCAVAHGTRERRGRLAGRVTPQGGCYEYASTSTSASVNVLVRICMYICMLVLVRLCLCYCKCACALVLVLLQMYLC